MDIETRIAHRLKALRAARAWTLEDLAARSGVSRAMISRIERLESSPTAGLLSRLSDTLGVTLSSLMAEDEARPVVSRRDAQLSWRDPGTGYLRRMVSPAGRAADTDIVAIELPPTTRVPYTGGLGARREQQVLLIEGELHLEIGDERLVLHPGDCARMPTDRDHAFDNRSARTARYLVVSYQVLAAAHPGEPA